MKYFVHMSPKTPMSAEYSSENLLFWTAVQDFVKQYKAQSSYNSAEATAFLIYTNFIQVQAHVHAWENT